MENASKALIMAGGVLIALLVIGILLFTVTKIGDYQRSQDTSKKNSQVANFNMDFERYTDDKGIKGADIVSLINKINDYNVKSNKNGVDNSGITNYVDYNIKMSITVSKFQKFNDKYANDKDNLFKKDEYKFDKDADNNNEIRNILSTFKNSAKDEGEVGIENLKKLSSVYNPGVRKDVNINNIKEELKKLFPTEYEKKYKDWNGQTAPTLNTIIKYRQYSEFKSSTFIVRKPKNDEPPMYADNGQIQNLYFEFDR